MNNILKIRKEDVVAVALADIKKGSVIVCNGKEIIVNADIPRGHKVAVTNINKGEKVIKYGFSIGTAKSNIKIGDHVHTHNVATALTSRSEYTYNHVVNEIDCVNFNGATFNGYMRQDGNVGVRNEVWVIPTVGCVNAIAKQIAENAQKYKGENIDGIFHFSHPYGCSQLGGDMVYTQKLLAGMVNHANAGAVLVLGLGCENNLISEFKKVLGETDSRRVAFMNCQDYDDEYEKADEIMKKLCEYANGFKRTPCPVSKLTLGLKCGGSDGFSGITANPLVGMVADSLVCAGGKVILTEVPEMFGAETVLMDRCKNEETFNKTVELVNNFKDYFGKYGEGVGENPSPGNKAGGITTLEDKSLGCIQKGGFSQVNDVISYGDVAKEAGLSLLQAPGNDLVATCALCAAGAQIVLFTTGRGTPFAGPVPTVKIATNSDLAKRKSGWIDFDAGKIVSEGSSFQTLNKELFEFILEIANGKQVKSEKLSKSELAIFKDGVTL